VVIPTLASVFQRGALLAEWRVCEGKNVVIVFEPVAAIGAEMPWGRLSRRNGTACMYFRLPDFSAARDFSVADRIFLFAGSLFASSPSIGVERALLLAMQITRVMIELEKFRNETAQASHDC